MDISSELLKLDVEGKLKGMPINELKKRLQLLCGSVEEEKPANTFWPILQEYIDIQKNSGTKSVYMQTQSRLMAFDQHIEQRKFEDMDIAWMQRLDEFLALTAPKRNARNIHFRNIRRIFNYAIKVKGLSIPYPFQTLKIKAEATANHALLIEQLRQLRTYEINEPHLAKYRDIFMLMVYLRGINSADLFSALKTQVTNGRLEYVRKKTGVFYSVKIEPEAKAILDKYPGNTYLLDVCETWSNPTDYLRKMDKGLKKIGPMERKGKGGKKSYKSLFPDLSSNWARHTFTSLAASLNIPIELASESLGHKIGSPTTNIYIHYIRKQVDEVARKIIDHIIDPKAKKKKKKK